jgi:hypothetical protein
LSLADVPSQLAGKQFSFFSGSLNCHFARAIAMLAQLGRAKLNAMNVVHAGL